ncbi:hypothetical protein WJX77_008097 [Trebouxia sp. C0004]
MLRARLNSVGSSFFLIGLSVVVGKHCQCQDKQVCSRFRHLLSQTWVYRCVKACLGLKGLQGTLVGGGGTGKKQSQEGRGRRVWLSHTHEAYLECALKDLFGLEAGLVKPPGSLSREQTGRLLSCWLPQRHQPSF